MESDVSFLSEVQQEVFRDLRSIYAHFSPDVLIDTLISPDNFEYGLSKEVLLDRCLDALEARNSNFIDLTGDPVFPVNPTINAEVVTIHAVDETMPSVPPSKSKPSTSTIGDEQPVAENLKDKPGVSQSIIQIKDDIAPTETGDSKAEIVKDEVILYPIPGEDTRPIEEDIIHVDSFEDEFVRGDNEGVISINDDMSDISASPPEVSLVPDENDNITKILQAGSNCKDFSRGPGLPRPKSPDDALNSRSVDMGPLGGTSADHASTPKPVFVPFNHQSGGDAGTSKAREVASPVSKPESKEPASSDPKVNSGSKCQSVNRTCESKDKSCSKFVSLSNKPFSGSHSTAISQFVPHSPNRAASSKVEQLLHGSPSSGNVDLKGRSDSASGGFRKQQTIPSVSGQFIKQKNSPFKPGQFSKQKTTKNGMDKSLVSAEPQPDDRNSFVDKERSRLFVAKQSDNSQSGETNVQNGRKFAPSSPSQFKVKKVPSDTLAGGLNTAQNKLQSTALGDKVLQNQSHLKYTSRGQFGPVSSTPKGSFSNPPKILTPLERRIAIARYQGFLPPDDGLQDKPTVHTETGGLQTKLGSSTKPVSQFKAASKHQAPNSTGTVKENPSQFKVSGTEAPPKDSPWPKGSSSSNGFPVLPKQQQLNLDKGAHEHQGLYAAPNSPVPQKKPELNKDIPQLQGFRAASEIPIRKEQPQLNSDRGELPHGSSAGTATPVPQKQPQVHRSAPHLNKDVPQLNRDVPQLNRDVPQMNKGVPQLNKAVPQLDRGVPQLSKDVPQLNKDIPKFNLDVPQLNTYVPQLNKDVPLPQASLAAIEVPIAPKQPQVFAPHTLPTTVVDLTQPGPSREGPFQLNLPPPPFRAPGFGLPPPAGPTFPSTSQVNFIPPPAYLQTAATVDQPPMFPPMGNPFLPPAFQVGDVVNIGGGQGCDCLLMGIPCNHYQAVQPPRPAEGLDTMMARVIGLFPDVNPDFVREKLGVAIGSYPDPVQWLCNQMLEEQYPKKLPPAPTTAKPKATSSKPKEKTFDYLNDWRELPRSSHVVESRQVLGSVYQWVSMITIDDVLRATNNHVCPSLYVLQKVVETKEYAHAVKQRIAHNNRAGLRLTVELPGERKGVSNGEKKEKRSFHIKLNKNPRKAWFKATQKDVCKEIRFFNDYQKDKQLESDHQLAMNMNQEEYEQNQQGIECECCFVEYPFENMVQCFEMHLFCSECLQRYVKESVFGQGKGNLSCMASDCSSTFPREQLEKTLTPEMLAKYDERLREESVHLADLQDLVRCPHCQFAASLEMEIKAFLCPQCGRETCRECQVDWTEHFGKKCSEVENKSEEELRTKYEEKLTEALIRNCHRCKAPIIKENGCNKMTCRCGAKMCYICRKPNIDYDHFCRHVRDPNVKGCKKCNACCLWEVAEVADEKKMAEIKDDLKKEQDQKGIDTSKRAVGVPDALGPGPSKKPRNN